MEDLAKRAVACKHWRWMAGMLTNDGRVLAFDPYMYSDDADDVWDFRVSVIQGPYRENIGIDDLLPDLTDPATLGCLLHLVINAVSDFNTACHLDNISLGTFNIPEEMAAFLVEALEEAE